MIPTVTLSADPDGFAAMEPEEAGGTLAAAELPAGDAADGTVEAGPDVETETEPLAGLLPASPATGEATGWLAGAGGDEPAGAVAGLDGAAGLAPPHAARTIAVRATRMFSRG